jgi:hypothetical protein
MPMFRFQSPRVCAPKPLSVSVTAKRSDVPREYRGLELIGKSGITLKLPDRDPHTNRQSRPHQQRRADHCLGGRKRPPNQRPDGCRLRANWISGDRCPVACRSRACLLCRYSHSPAIREQLEITICAPPRVARHAGRSLRLVTGSSPDRGVQLAAFLRPIYPQSLRVWFSRAADGRRTPIGLTFSRQ